MKNAPITRPTLLLRLRDVEDVDAWNEFVRLYTPLIFGHCLRQGLQEADAADVAQEVMRAVARAMGRFEYRPQQGTFRSWLYTVTRSKLNNFLSQRQRQPQGTGETAVQEFIEAQPCPNQDANWDREYHQRLFDWACEAVRAEFHEATWRAFWMLAVEEKPGQEVATALGLSVGAAYIARSRVTARIRERIASIVGDEWPAQPGLARPSAG